MNLSDEDFRARVHRVRQVWHEIDEIDNALKDFERRAKNDPKACAEEALRKVAYEANLYRVTHKRVFGLDLEHKEDRWERVPLPPDPDSRALFIDCVQLYKVFKDEQAKMWLSRIAEAERMRGG